MPHTSFANAVPWRLSRRDNFVAKAPEQVTGGLTPPTLPAHTSAPLAFMRGNLANQISYNKTKKVTTILARMLTEENKIRKL